MSIINFKKYESESSKFLSELGEYGGYINFSNSGKGGAKKWFTLSVNSFIQCLKDIKSNLVLFKPHENYVEREWRDLGSEHYTDRPANAQCTVQTKPMFTTLSKLIMWANEPDLFDVDPESTIRLSENYIDITIKRLEDGFGVIPLTQKAKTEEVSDTSIRDFAFAVFGFFYKDKWSSLLEQVETKDSKLNDIDYNLCSYKELKNLIGRFDAVQAKDTLTSSSTKRFFEEPILIDDKGYYYFSTQWNGKGDHHLSFKNLKKVIERDFPNYEVLNEDGVFILRLKTIDFSMEDFYKDSLNANLKYDNQLLTRYVSSLITKPFVLLSGLSGSGKTKLAQSFAQWICEDESQYNIVPVGADWTNREPLLGYTNALDTDAYMMPENEALQLIIDANRPENSSKPYFLILDEMNLSHVERYFADFLSVMESNSQLKLHNDSAKKKSGVPHALSWPSNLFVIGTVNIDETTYMFSPKVLDRANVIEFRVSTEEITDFLAAPQAIDLAALKGKGAAMGSSFVNMAINKEFETSDSTTLNKALVSFFDELKKTGAEFGYRTAMEIHRLCNQLSVVNKEISDKEKIDIAIMQKLLPKLHGSRRKLVDILKALAKQCVEGVTDVEKEVLNEPALDYTDKEKVLYPLSLEKIVRMYKSLMANGFASYAEA